MNCPYDYDDPEFRLEWFEDRLEKVELERDALWVKTQEDEREINDLRDINKQLRERLTNYLEAFVRFNKDIEVFKQ